MEDFINALRALFTGSDKTRSERLGLKASKIPSRTDDFMVQDGATAENRWQEGNQNYRPDMFRVSYTTSGDGSISEGLLYTRNGNEVLGFETDNGQSLAPEKTIEMIDNGTIHLDNVDLSHGSEKNLGKTKQNFNDSRDDFLNAYRRVKGW